MRVSGNQMSPGVPGSAVRDIHREPTAEDMGRFDDLLRRLGAPFALSGVSFYRFTRLGEVENRKKQHWLQIEQFHAELLQAIALRMPDVWQHATGRREEIEQLQGLLALLPNSGWTPSDEYGLVGPEQVAELIRGETRFVRNWAQPHQLLAWLLELFEPMDAQYRKSMGVGLTDLVRLIQRLTLRLNERSEHFVRWHNALAASRPTDWAKVAEHFWPDSPSTAALAEELSARGDVELLLHHPLPSLFTWRLDDLMGLVNSDATGLNRVLVEWSMPPAQTPYVDLGRLMLDNPVWVKPFVRLTDAQFFLPFPTLLYSFGLQLMELACKLSPDTYRRYVDKKWRSRFVERKLAELLKGAFVGSRIYIDNPYPGGQNDVALRLDDFFLVLEAKSGHVAQSARRGGIESMRRALDEIVLQGSDQAYRFIEFLREAQGRGEPAMLADGRHIDVRDVAQYIPCVVHLEPLGRLGADTKRLHRLFARSPTDKLPAMTMSLADLGVIATLLDTPEERFHYLYRRRQLELRRSYAADEMDLLAVYFDNQLNFDDRFPDGELLLYGKSTPVDRWLSREEELTPVAKPHRRMSRRFKDAMSRVAGHRKPGWLRIALLLQDVFDETQRGFEHQLRLMVKTLRRKHGGVVGGVIDQGLTEGRLAFSYLAFANMDRDDARELVFSELDELVGSDRYAETLVIAIDAGLDAFPYSLIAGGVRAWNAEAELDKGTVLG